MYQLKCEEFYCKIRKTCLFVDSCELCKIVQCKICIFEKACEYNKERKKDESEIRSKFEGNNNTRY